MPKDEFMDGVDVSLGLLVYQPPSQISLPSSVFQGSTDGVNTPASGEELSSSVDDSPPAKTARTEEDSGEYFSDFRKGIWGQGFLYIAAICIYIYALLYINEWMMHLRTNGSVYQAVLENGKLYFYN